MKLQEIVDAVVGTTGRPDKSDDIMRAVRAAVTEVHGSAAYPRDRVEELFPLAEATALIKLTLPPRFRKFEVLGAFTDQGTPVSLSTANNQYSRVDPSAIFNGTLDTRTDVYYVAGAALNIRSSIAVKNIYAIYRRFPEVADTQLETWIMEDQPSLIIDLTLSKVQGGFGRDKLAREAFSRWEIAMTSFIFDNLVEGDN